MANSTGKGSNGGNVNQLGVPSVGSTRGTHETLGLTRPGKITKGPARNKPRIHLVSSKGKVPAIIYAEAIAQRQKQKAVNPTVKSHPELASETSRARDGSKVDRNGGNPQLKKNQLSNPRGVAPRPNPRHQNNPAFAGSFTKQYQQYAAFVKAQNNLGVKAPVNP